MSIMDYTKKQDEEDPPLYESRLFYFWPSEICRAFVKDNDAGDGRGASQSTKDVRDVFSGRLFNHLKPNDSEAPTSVADLKKSHIIEAFEIPTALSRLCWKQMTNCLV